MGILKFHIQLILESLTPAGEYRVAPPVEGRVHGRPRDGGGEGLDRVGGPQGLHGHLAGVAGDLGSLDA